MNGVEWNRVVNGDEYRALHDDVTDLPNRTLLFDRLTHAIEVARREREPVAVLVLDINGFERLNEELGREGGDSILRLVGQSIRGTLRASDTVSRTDGDQFTVLLPGASAIGALGTANKILRRLSRDMDPESGLTSKLATVGISIYPDHGATASELLQNGLAALLQARADDQNACLFS